MGFIQSLIPVNLEEERAKFFSSNRYNPQFRYRWPVKKSQLTSYGLPSPEIITYAQRMLAKHGIPDFEIREPVLSKVEIETVLTNTLAQLGLPPIPITYSDQYSARFMLSKDGLHIRLPIKITKNTLTQLLNHEIQTHYLRTINHSNHFWHAEFPVNLQIARITEEGLALLNTYQEIPQPFAKQFLTTSAEAIAQTQSFRDVFSFLQSLGISDDLAWRFTLKQKRGLEDTSQPGGFLKSHIYLMGAKKVANWLSRYPTKLAYLFAGKISLEDINQIEAINGFNSKLILPTFIADPSTYLERISQLRVINEL